MSPPDSYSVQSRVRLTLHLGVLIQPYAGNSFTNHSGRKQAKGKAWRANTKNNPLTTGDVAEILESKYGIMEAFYRTHEANIAKAVESSLSGALEALIGAGQAVDPWGAAMQTIQQDFRDFINSKQAERVGIPGTPTGAALAGVNHRLAHPYASSNPRRPSFRDTGLYSASFRAFVD